MITARTTPTIRSFLLCRNQGVFGGSSGASMLSIHDDVPIESSPLKREFDNREPLSLIKSHATPNPMGTHCEVKDCKDQPLRLCPGCVRYYCSKHYEEHKEWLPGT